MSTITPADPGLESEQPSPRHKRRSARFAAGLTFMLAVMVALIPMAVVAGVAVRVFKLVAGV